MQTITVDMTPGFRQPTIHYSQNDVGTTFAIDLRSRFGDTLPASPTVKIQATKPSGFGFSIEADSVVGSVATFTTVDTMTDEAGRFQAELQIIKDAVVIYTANFYMEGEANPHPIGTTDGSQETIIPTLTLLVERVEAAAASVNDLTVSATTLPAGSDATAVFDSTTDSIAFGIPRGADGEVTEEQLDAAITDVKSDLINISGNGIISIKEQGKYIDTSASSVTISGGVPVATGTSATYSYGCVACTAGDEFVINGTGGNQTRLWAFVSSTGSVLERSGGSASATNLLITAPTNAAFLIVHGKTTEWKSSYVGKRLVTRVDELESTVDTVIDELQVNESFVWESGYISYSDGSTSANNSRIRTKDYIPYDSNTVMHIGTGIKYRLIVYADKSEDSFVFGTSTWGLGSYDDGHTFKEIEEYYGVTPTNFNYFRITMGKSDDSRIYQEDIYALGKKFTTTHYIRSQEISDIVANEEITYRSTVVGNCSIRCAKELSFTDGTAPLIEWFLLEEPLTGRFYYSKDLIEKKYLFTFPYKSYQYSFGILHNGDVIAVLDADNIDPELGKHDSNRQNPYVFLASENWSVCHEVDFGANMKPCGWLSNCGYKVLADGSAIFCEYTRQTTETANVWKLSGDPTDYTNWVLTKSFEITSTDNQTNFKHCHMVQQDFYTGKCYLSTGDDSVGAMMWYSADNGSTWTQLRSPDSTGGQDEHGWYQGSQMFCRMLTLAFTEEYIYWATDTYINDIHYLFRVERDANGVFDYSTVELLTQIPYANGAATYGVALIPELDSILLLDRTDTSENSMPVRMITLDDNELHTIGTLYKEPYTASPKHLGFRTRFSEWYPIDGVIRFGFGLQVDYYNDDVNHNRGFGNLGSPQKWGAETVNNLVMRVRKDGSNYRFTLNTFNI